MGAGKWSGEVVAFFATYCQVAGVARTRSVPSAAARRRGLVARPAKAIAAKTHSSGPDCSTR
jgi:hypothetical protein